MESTPFGDFDLVSPLAKGGMAELFMARHRPTNQLVVIKRLLPEFLDREDVIELFLTEADIGRMMQHENVVRIFDAGEVDGVYYIVMEYIDGPDVERVLSHALSNHKMVPPDLVLRIGVDALRGLHSAHHLKSPQGTFFGVVHRDVSPDNLFITRAGVTKVADFGIAKLANMEGVTSTGLLKGKMTYMAPEQVRSTQLDGRADEYTLALILFEMLSGKRPFQQQPGESEVETLMRVRKGKVPSLMDFDPTVAPSICKVIDKALRRWRFFRYKTCGAFADALEFEAAKLDILATREELAAYVEHIY